MKTNRSFLPAAALLATAFAFVPPLHAAEVEEESQRLLGIETADLTEKQLPPEAAVYGSVLAPAPLIDLFRQIAAAREAVEISNESLDRAEKLFASGELVARKDVQAAKTQQAKDHAILRGLEDRLVLEWGQRFSAMNAAERTKLLEDLLGGRQALIRLSVSRGEPLVTSPLAARLHLFGHEREPFRCTVILPAPATDPAFQSKTFLGLLDTRAAPLAAGLMLTGALELTGDPRTGLFVPQGAVVFYLGSAWVYRKTGDKDFERVGISTATPVAGGWFVEGDALDPHQIVMKGAQSLLSQETLRSSAEE